MKLSHQEILRTPEVLLIRQFKIRQRHEFLVKLGRNQYDRTKELYISPGRLCTASNQEFVEDLAKSCMTEYNQFLKSQ